VRAVHASDLAMPGGIDCGPRMVTVKPEATVEDLLARLADGTTGFSVARADGQMLGSIDAKSVLAVLDRDRERRR
jgi:CBS-domain-containing membrane protein